MLSYAANNAVDIDNKYQQKYNERNNKLFFDQWIHKPKIVI